MDEILGGVIRVIGWLLRAVLEVLVEGVLFWMGWPFVKAFTLGRYPRGRFLDDMSESAWVSAVGLLVCVLALLLAMWLL
ncbi:MULTISPECIES: hypothetical protein [Pseudomonas]|uniref:hypothetical protein n=1 Tax=Pseudomonas TaxID=286 RepID=UPI001BCA7513|nr:MULTISPECIES: hypothetical protein [Pseudomonas]UXY50743.1 hypothetical protein N9L84_17370 [Pseudomonas tohonis]BBP83955.1 hypothetical protein PHLH8_35970 [Pseudomonas sp. Pc102]